MTSGVHIKGAVYRHISASGEVLYVGCSANPFQRFTGHRSKSAWATDVVRIEIHWFETQDEALKEELRLIKELRPRFNRQLCPNRKVRRDSIGPLLLSAWMARTGVSIGDLARALGESASSAKSLLGRTANPRHLKCCKVSVITGGVVPSYAWPGSGSIEVTPSEARMNATASANWLRRFGHTVPTCLNTPATRSAA